MSREQTKAAHYIQQLDEARCDGNWDVVPELARKVRKHAPQRTCLVITAESEHAVVQESQSRPQTGTTTHARSSTAISKHSSGLSEHIPLLLEAIGKEQYHKEDVYQAKVCLGWIHWQLGDSSLAASSLPSGIEEEFSQLDGTNTDTTEWTKVCAVKASYIKGSSQQRSGAVADALETFGSALPIIGSNPPGPKQGRELRTWSELYLTSFCMISSQIIKSSINSILETEALSAFRTWAKFWEAQSPAPLGGRSTQAGVSRRHVWREYYFALSNVLQGELPFPTTSLTTAYTEVSTRLQQRAELKKVEARYEALLLSEVQFPRAEEASEEVEVFVNVVMQNWRILCGNNWKEHDLGEGGAEAISRGVLDILYRAATKTFHSTSILRHLFTVHLTIAEFELAFKAFDTYMEVVKKGKAREEKTGEAEHSFDDDEMVLKTASEGIKALCRYGSQQEAEKAKDLGHYFEIWLDKHHPSNIQSGHLDTPILDAAVQIAPKTYALAWRCIGIAHAQWARYTYDVASRTEIQLRALKCFRKSLLPQYESSRNVETLFPLGILLAERRELTPAIEVVKSGLLSNPSQPKSSALHKVQFARERSLIPLWHLMSLLLSARQEFLTAARTCEGAFEQFQNPKNLFGEPDYGTYRSSHLNEKLTHQSGGIVEDMDDFEKENILQVKMTQLALVEILEGPDVAVNASDELLSLYTRLFGDPQADSTVPISTSAPPPQSSAGTIKSIKGSIFGRSGRSVRKSHTTIPNSSEKDASLARPQTMASVRAPTIHITGENGIAAKQRPSTRDGSSQHHEKLQKRPGSLSNKRNGSKTAMVRSPSVGRLTSNSRIDNQVQTGEVEGKLSIPPIEKQDPGQWMNETEMSYLSYSGPSLKEEIEATGNLKLEAPVQLSARGRSKHQQRDKGSSFPTENSTLAQDNRIPRVSFESSVTPVTRFPKNQRKRRRTALLIKVWLLISGFYRRACMYEDAKAAIEEAQILVNCIETDSSKDTNHVSVQETGWEGAKSTAELRSDIESERGYVALAEETPYVAMAHFENALSNYGDHPTAIVGISKILLDIYAEDLLPPPSIPNLVLPGPINTPSASTSNSTIIATPLSNQPLHLKHSSSRPAIHHGPLGLPSAQASLGSSHESQTASTPSSFSSGLQPSYTESSTALLDRLAARDRAYGLLTTLTKLGAGWNYSEAWFALARAYEEGGQPDKAREVLWWCVELEEGRAIRDWNVVGCGGYVL